ncbi:MAG: carboxypeptidase M32 [Bdellovibrionales bacterium]|nr:carboxypeptidase M32 [Bdellovibrionales bacterium]
MSIDNLLQQYRSRMETLFQLRSVSALLDWDQQVNLPVKGAADRANQLELLSTLVHKAKTDPELMRILCELYNSLDSLSEPDQVNIRETKIELEREAKLPEEYVARVAKASAECYTAWVRAKKENDFSSILPLLERNISLAKEKIDLVGYTETPYDALLYDFEQGSTLSAIQPPLLALAKGIQAMLPALYEKCPKTTPKTEHFCLQKQEALCKHLASQIGYNLDSGRLDTAPHPFMTTLGAHDKRITTRYSESDYLSSVLTVLHEAGHAIYEQGLLDEWAGTPMAEAVSLSIHESQSRIFENIFGRSKSFAHYIYSILDQYFPEEHAKTSPEHIWQQLNGVHPSFIRVQADEVTYSLHVVLRLELEEMIFNQNLPVNELPEAWNAKYEEHLGLKVPSDTLGVLQDVHWYSVGFGYFPTYALGNLYSGIMRDAMLAERPDFEASFQDGDFSFPLYWLREHVHSQGKRFTGIELARKLSGEPLSEKPFLSYLKAKFNL